MKDVRQCSISSVAFTLEVDAYDTLYNYLESIRERYNDNPDGEEILADIEARIAELILAVHSADRVVAKPLINNIISQMGSVDDICADSLPPDQEPQQEPHAKTKSRAHRQLYRNIDDAPIGGVCSGIAAYIGCGVALVRVIALLLLIFGGASVWIYIILWIAMPAARTAAQKLEMRGEPITVETIKDYYNSATDNLKARSLFSSILSGIGRIIMLIFKIVVALALAALICALIVTMLGIILFVAMGGIISGGDMIMGDVTAATIIVTIMSLLAVGTLLWLGVYTAIQILNSKKIKLSVILATIIICLILTLSTLTIALQNQKGINSSIGNLREWVNG